jgi:hypothetical protein
VTVEKRRYGKVAATFFANSCYDCIYTMRYEWDERKNRLNQKKHRISFEIAALEFEDECCLVRPDRVD